jgi:hypothetical protein
MHPIVKFFITITAIVITIAKCWVIKDERKRIFLIMAIMLAISTFSNRSIYWFLYWDGPYYGQVVDADTGEPIKGASVAGIWQFETYTLFIASETHFANAKETVTDEDGKFTIPLTFAFTSRPTSVLEKMKLVVFKPGYDSHPPAIERKMKQPPDGLRISPDGRYIIGNYASCKAWRKCVVRLNKAITIKERRRASAKCSSALMEWDINPSKIKKFIKALKKDDPYFKKYMEN